MPKALPYDFHISCVRQTGKLFRAIASEINVCDDYGDPFLTDSVEAVQCKKRMCLFWIWGSHYCDYERYGLRCCNAVFGKFRKRQTFRRNVDFFPFFPRKKAAWCGQQAGSGSTETSSCLRTTLPCKPEDRIALCLNCLIAGFMLLYFLTLFVYVTTMLSTCHLSVTGFRWNVADFLTIQEGRSVWISFDSLKLKNNTAILFRKQSGGFISFFSLSCHLN